MTHLGVRELSWVAEIVEDHIERVVAQNSSPSITNVGTPNTPCAVAQSVLSQQSLLDSFVFDHRASIRDAEFLREIREHVGIRYIAPLLENEIQRGSTAWGVLLAPTTRRSACRGLKG